MFILPSYFLKHVLLSVYLANSSFQIDDAEDVDVLELLIDPQPPEGFEVVTTETVPGLASNIRQRNLQAFNRVWKGKIPTTQAARHFNRCFEMILRVG